MATIDLKTAKAHLSRLVDEAAAGHEIIITKAGMPVAKLVPLEAIVRRERTIGHLRYGIIPVAFDMPLPNGVLDSFE